MVEKATPERKSRDRCVIAHISDLHFTSRTDIDDSPLVSLLQDLRAQKIDAVVVTGDVIDGNLGDVFFDSREAVLDRVREFLEGPLATAAKINPSEALFVVPGNHDYRVKGLMWQGLEGGAFARCLGAFFRPLMLPTLGVCVFTMDSNSLGAGVTLATGRVDESDLDAFARQVEWIRQEDPVDWERCVSILLLHHHPMPIAATEHRDALDGEQWTLLKNAGRLMNHAVRHGVDVVLHGHQHVPAISKAAFPLGGDDHYHHIAVVGAGSVGSMRRQCSYNVLSIEASGAIVVERRDLDGALYQPSLKRNLTDYDDARRRKRLRLAQTVAPRLRARRHIRWDDIQESGDINVEETWEDVTAIGSDRVDGVVLDGTEMPWPIREDEVTSLTQRQQVTVEASDGSDKQLTFSPALTRDRTATFSRKMTLVNAIHFNQQDVLDVTGEARPRESLSSRASQIVSDVYVRHVRFPDGREPASPMLTVLDNRGIVDVAEWEHFERSICWIPGTKTLAMTLDKPLPGFEYRLAWQIPKIDPKRAAVPPTVAMEADRLVTLLLKLRESEHRDLRVQLESLLEDVMEQAQTACRELPSLRFGNEDELGVVLWCWNADSGHLVPVAGCGMEARIWERDVGVRLGVTCVGQALRRRQVIHWRYLPNDDPQDYEGSRHAAILAVPLGYPTKDGVRLGVVSIASSRPGSHLAELLLSGDTNWLPLVDAAMSIPQRFVGRLRSPSSGSLAEKED